jgi:hypothetical protein
MATCPVCGAKMLTFGGVEKCIREADHPKGKTGSRTKDSREGREDPDRPPHSHGKKKDK